MGRRHLRGYRTLEDFEPGRVEVAAVIAPELKRAELVAGEAEDLFGGRPQACRALENAIAAIPELAVVDIVAAAAVTLYRVGTVKDLPGIRTYVAVDGGMSDNPRPVLYGSGYETLLPRAANAERPRAVRVVGKHCEAGDLLVREGWVPEDMAVGDVLATPVTGAYGHSMGSNYNQVLRPAVVFVADGRARQVVRRETFEDLISREG